MEPQPPVVPPIDGVASLNVSKPSSGRPPIPALVGKTLSSFGRRDSQYLPFEFPLRIDNQDTFSGRTYDQMLQLVNADLPVTREEFIRMWKTILYKRTQDVYSAVMGSLPVNWLNISRSLPLPAPLADVTDAIGEFYSIARGIQCIATPPVIPANHLPWMDLDADLIQRWGPFCNRFKTLFAMGSLPPLEDYNNRPLMLTTIQDDNALRTIRAHTNEATSWDCYIRFLNDDLFTPQVDITNDSNSYFYARLHDRNSEFADYLNSYVLDSNS